MSRISQNLQDVHARIVAAAAKVSRDANEITLLAVSKTFDAETVMQAVLAGQRDFGENYVQEALEKIEKVRCLQNNVLPDSTQSPVLLKWHFIGPVQSNKTRFLATHFDWVHSIESERIARRLSDQRPHNAPDLNICIQVNISNEPGKSGVAVQDALALAHAVTQLPRLRLRGLMAIPKIATDFEEQRLAFRQVRELYQSMRDQGLIMDTLSMGMSADLEAAVAEGATILRIGSAIFGHRL